MRAWYAAPFGEAPPEPLEAEPVVPYEVLAYEVLAYEGDLEVVFRVVIPERLSLSRHEKSLPFLRFQ